MWIPNSEFCWVIFWTLVPSFLLIELTCASILCNKMNECIIVFFLVDDLFVIKVYINNIVSFFNSLLRIY